MPNPFGFILTIFLYFLFLKTGFLKKVPIIINAGVSIILLLKIFHIDYEVYHSSSNWLTFMIAPATVAFAYPLYKNSNLLLKNKRILYSSFFIATFTAFLSTYFSLLFFHPATKIIASSIPKSTTMPIALEISKIIGGSSELTAVLVVITGVLGGAFGHFILSKFKVKNDVAIGLALGSASHIIGTASCAQKGKTLQVASGTIALILVGFLSVLFAPLIKLIL